jgi:hypothetical protein
MTRAAKQVACLLVRVEKRPSSSLETCERVTLALVERAGRRDNGSEYHTSPDVVNGLQCDHGELLLQSYAFGGKAGIDGPQYDAIHHVDAYKLEAYTKTLHTLGRRMAKMRETRGSVTTWAEQAVRFAEACGASFVVFPADVAARLDKYRGRRCARDLMGERYVWLTTGDAAAWLRDLEGALAHETDPSIDRPAEETSAA